MGRGRIVAETQPRASVGCFPLEPEFVGIQIPTLSGSCLISIQTGSLVATRAGQVLLDRLSVESRVAETDVQSVVDLTGSMNTTTWRQVSAAAPSRCM
jgi:hypothetical protein